MIASFHLVQDLRGYATSAHLASQKSGSVPLLVPDESKQLNRWIKILRWYGLKSSPPTDHHDGSVPATEEEHLIVSLGEEFAPLAKFYADVMGRSLLLASDKQMTKIVSDTNYKSIMFIAPPTYFDVERIRKIGRHALVPWGFVTAAGLPQMSFVLAKLLALSSNHKRNWGVLDIISSTYRFVHSDLRRNAESRLTPHLIHDLITNRSWQALAIRAHGEASHVNLNRVVLCGLTEEIERATTGRLLDGCRHDSASRSCKRVQDENIEVLSFGDIRAKHLFIFSCIGYSLGGELYPSYSSGVYSASEGYPAMALFTNQVLLIDPGEPIRVLELCRQGIAAGEAVRVQNDLTWRRIGAPPYVLFGDPYGPTISTLIPSKSGSITVSKAQPISSLRSRHWADKVIVAIETKNEAARLVRGEREAVLTVTSRTLLPVRLVDRIELWKAKDEWFRGVARRLESALRLEMAISQMYALRLKKFLAFQRQLKALSQVREELNRTVEASLFVLKSIRRTGVWRDDLVGPHEARCLEQIEGWDKQLATMVDQLLASDIQDLLLSCFDLQKERGSSRCDYCHSRMSKEERISADGRSLKRFSLMCPSCGTREVWTENGPRLNLEVPGRLNPNSIVKLNVRIAPPAGTKPQSMKGQLCVELEDKGSRKMLFFQTVEVSGSSYKLIIRVPSEITAELHTLKLIWISNLWITYQRRRTAGERLLRDALHA